MSKRDYKSYNVLAEELETDQIIEVDDLLGDTSEHELGNVAEVKQEENIEEEIIEAQLVEDMPISNQDNISVSNQEDMQERMQEYSSEVIKEEVQEVIEVPQVLFKKVSDSHEVEDKREKKEPEAYAIKPEEQAKKVKYKKLPTKEQKVNLDKAEAFSFDNYKENYQKKNTNKAIKRTVGIFKVLVICMLSPVILILLGCIFVALAAAVVGIGTCFVIGAMLIGMACFMSTQLHTSMIVLLVSAGISGVSLGGILLILFIIGLKWIIGLIKKLRKSKQVTNKEGQ